MRATRAINWSSVRTESVSPAVASLQVPWPTAPAPWSTRESKPASSSPGGLFFGEASGLAATSHGLSESCHCARARHAGGGHTGFVHGGRNRLVVGTEIHPTHNY